MSVELETAKNPNTSSTRLTELAANTSDKRVLDNVLCNPNTSVSTLIEVAGKYVESFEALANNPTIDEKILQFPSLIEAVYVKLQNNCIFVAEWNFSLPEKLLKHTFNSSVKELRIMVANNPNSSQIILEKLANDRDSYVRKKVAQNPNTGTITLERLCQDSDYFIRIEVARHEQSNEHVLKTLANDINDEVRAAAATNQNIDSKTLEKLIKDRDSDVRWNAILNPKISLFAKLVLLPAELIRDN